MFKINRNSIFFSLTIVFFATLVLIILSSIFLYISNSRFEELNLGKKYHPIVRMVLKECHFTDEIQDDLQNELKHINLIVIKSKDEFDHITKNGIIKVQLKKNEHTNIKVLEYQNYHYLDIATENNHFLLKDTNEIKSNSYLIILIFALIIVSFIFLFLTTLKKLYPIKQLQEKITKLGDENFDFSDETSQNQDEISQLSREFSKSAKKLKEIKEARNIFIRNIMHELKTPITKGKFLIELPCDEENKSLMKKVFYRLESLINEFASIEELIASKELKTKEYFIADIVDNALDLMMNFQDEIELEIKDEKIAVNFKLFSIAIKNLLDNAVKYSPTKKAKLIASHEQIEILNDGEPLKFELEHYFEPFSKEAINHDGFGLGLYITSHILKAHNFKFSYTYQDGKNIFCIKL